MEDGRKFEFIPAPRCCDRRADSTNSVCGKIAAWRAPDAITRVLGFHCDDHRAPSDEPIAGEIMARRVAVTVQAFFLAVELGPGAAHAEAYERLELAVREAGGVVNLVAITSEVGRGTVQARQDAPLVGKGGA